MQRQDVSPDLWEAFRDVIRDWSLSKFERVILAATSPAIEFSVAHGELPCLRRTKIGGFPDLPADAIWPELHGMDVPFVAQVDFSELPPLVENSLPDSGVLSFFHWATNETAGPMCRVLYSGPNVARMTRHSVSEDQILQDWRGVRVYDEHRTSAANITLSFARGLAARLALRQQLIDSAEVADDIFAALSSVHFFHDLQQRLGKQGDVLAPVWGHMLGHSSDECLPDFETIESGLNRDGQAYVNLLELTSIDNMQWSDAGFLNFLLPETSLKAGDFEDAIAVINSP